MTENITRISHILLKKISETSLSVSESLELSNWLSESEAHQEWYNQIISNKSAFIRLMKRIAEDEVNSKVAWNRFSDRFFSATKEKKGKIIGFGRRFSIAASILVFISAAAFYFFLKHSSKPLDPNASISKADVPAPVGHHTILTLTDGTNLNLDSQEVGTLAVEGNLNISKTNTGIVYNAIGYHTSEKPKSAGTNTVTTALGGLTQIILPDHSRVWLNSLSSLRFPIQFSGGTREVILTGEAYFEVVKDALRPFIVKSAGLTIDVLGTSFNVKAYGDEPTITTTLLEGKVRLEEVGKKLVLAPGEQVETGSSDWKLNKEVDIDEAVSWKNGFFNFDHADLPNVMRQLARWYDVEVEYQGKISPQAYKGGIHRDLPLDEILQNLQALSNNEVHFHREGRKIIVSK